MKRVLLLMLVIVTTAIAMGQEVTPEQALQRAKKFMESHETTVNKQKRAAGKTSSLTMTSKVSGLYIFNVADDGGFVIVSNNERTVPILGFSDTGSFDPENIPDNMKAWLQGYADQIAWQEKQGTGGTVSNAPKRNATHSTNEIQPLIETKWDQGAPYNNKCPLYRTGYRSVTGCVATAMAQVMNYHQWPTDPTAEIPGYTTDSYGLNLSSLPTTTFDWANMSNTYTNNTTGATAEAVATLMQYCGWAVQMDYGPSSGASSSMKRSKTISTTIMKRPSLSPAVSILPTNGLTSSTTNWLTNALFFMAECHPAEDMSSYAMDTDTKMEPTSSTSTGDGAEKATNTLSSRRSIPSSRASEEALPTTDSTTDKMPLSAYKVLKKAEKWPASHPTSST